MSLLAKFLVSDQASASLVAYLPESRRKSSNRSDRCDPRWDITKVHGHGKLRADPALSVIPWASALRSPPLRHPSCAAARSAPALKVSLSALSTGWHDVPACPALALPYEPPLIDHALEDDREGVALVVGQPELVPDVRRRDRSAMG